MKWKTGYGLDQREPEQLGPPRWHGASDKAMQQVQRQVLSAEAAKLCLWFICKCKVYRVSLQSVLLPSPYSFIWWFLMHIWLPLSGPSGSGGNDRKNASCYFYLLLICINAKEIVQIVNLCKFQLGLMFSNMFSHLLVGPHLVHLEQIRMLTNQSTLKVDDQDVQTNPDRLLLAKKQRSSSVSPTWKPQIAHWSRSPGISPRAIVQAWMAAQLPNRLIRFH